LGVDITNGGSGTSSYSFVYGKSGQVVFQSSSVGPLAFSGSGSSFSSGGSGFNFVIINTSFVSVSSQSDSSLIFTDNISGTTQGATAVSISNSSFTNLTV
jgi:hypothetical protein